MSDFKLQDINRLMITNTHCMKIHYTFIVRSMNTHVLKNDGLLLITAIIWGLAFAAQRVGMDYIGPFTYNGVRFILGAFSIAPLLIYFNKKRKEPGQVLPNRNNKKLFLYGALAGSFLFLGASLQQVGIVYTTAGKAGFITGMYVVIVPFLGIFLGHKTGVSRWIGASLSIVGLYLLSIRGGFSISKGDFLVFLSAFFWASHVIAMAIISPKVDTLKLAAIQYLFCGILSLITAFIFETVAVHTILKAWLPIFYGSFFSVGIAYTLQIFAQKEAHPAHAAIILSLEGVFAVVGGWIFLKETMDIKSAAGCVLMLSGMFVSQAVTIRQSE